MPIIVPDDMIEVMRSGNYQLGVFVRVDLDEPLRIWLGVADIPAGITGIDSDGTEYLGGGRLSGVPELEAVINGVADRADFTISGIDPDYAVQLDPDDYPVRGKAVHVGVTVLDQYHQPMSAIIPLMKGRGTEIFERVGAVTGSESPTVTLGMSVGFGVTTRARESASLWSQPHQDALYPGDLFCAGTSRLERGVAPSWPRF